MEEEEDAKWAHINCILKLYGKRPALNPYDKHFTLEKDIMADGKVIILCLIE
jgi:hypothetical protein